MRIFILFSLFISLISANAQEHLNNALKSKLYNDLLGGQQFDVIVEGDINKIIAQEKALGIKVKYSQNSIASVSINAAAISKLLALKLVKQIEYIEPRKHTMNDTMIVRNRIKPVKLGASPLPQPYDGTGIIVGIIDSGCDFNHPDFKDASGNTRIKFIWDQTVTSPTTIPMPFGYGQEWTATQINLGVCTHSDVAYYGHGTHVSGIAAGNGLGNGTHEGVAPKADLVVVALDFNKAGPTIADGVKYIINKAAIIGKPFVINASVGDYYGSHDGTDSEAKLIDVLIANIPGRCMVAAAGNEGNVKFHTKNTVIPTDTNFTWYTNTGSVLNYWLYADTANIKNVKYSVGVNRAGTFFDLGNIGFKNYNYGIPTVKTDTLKYLGKRIARVQSSANINPYGVYELYIKVIADSLNYLWRIESTGTGLFDSWNFDFKSTGLPTTSVYPKIVKYTMPDTISSIVSSFQCSNEIIAVGNHVNLQKYYDVSGTLQTTIETPGQLADNSSAGPTRTNKIKPDVTATGASVFSCGTINQLPWLISTYPSVVASGSLHVLGGGTSAASPVVAGLAALYMQKYPNATNNQIKTAIINCAFSDAFTGTSLPNNKWGYGKLDGFATFTCSTIMGLEKINNYNDVRISPNPFNDISKISFTEVINGTVEIYNSIGKLIFMDRINSDAYSVKRSDLKSDGIYFVKIKSSTVPSQNYNIKLIAIE